MEFVLKIGLLLLIVNIVAIVRFTWFANLNKRNTIISMISLNMMTIIGVVLHKIGFERIDNSLLISLGIISIIVLFIIFYRNEDEKN